MSTLAVFAPFDLFGSPGAGAGAQLLADALREILDDNQHETRPIRASAYQAFVRIEEFEFGTFKDLAGWDKLARQLARRALKRREFLLWIGGNHLSALPVFEELGDDADTLVIQFDAHFDVYDFDDSIRTPSHGNYLRHAKGKIPPIVHVGSRDLFLPPESIAEHFRDAISAHDLAADPAAGIQRLRNHVAAAKRVWIDIDCDVLDPAYFPAVDGPLPFGLTPPLLLRLIDTVWTPAIAGVSISEFVPARDRADQSLGLLVWLLEWLLLKRYESAR